jgi:CHAD domain-containing protein
VAWSSAVAASLAVGFGLVLARAGRERRESRFKRVPAKMRRFGLLKGETPASGYRRIALAQLDIAIEHLRGESRAAPEEAVHETRKAIKRARALMRLLEGELGVKRANRERALLGDAAARLAGARDAEVMVSALDALVERYPRKLGGRGGVAKLRADLERERKRASARTLGDAPTRERVAEELAQVRVRVAAWKLPASRSAAELTEPGLEHIYRAGRAGLRRAGRRGGRGRHGGSSGGGAGARAFHRWRKHVKDLRYAAEVLDVREAEMVCAEGGSKNVSQGKAARKATGKRARKQRKRAAALGKRATKVARRADALGEMLGEEHDLMLLGERVRAHGRLRRRRKGTRRRLLKAISRRRARLRARALRDGERLYASKPRRFVRNLRA